MDTASNDHRALRMLMALLAATDPLGRLEAGAPADTYDGLALPLLATLLAGCDEPEVADAVRGWVANTDELTPRSQQRIARLAAAAVDWWRGLQSSGQQAEADGRSIPSFAG